MPAWPGELEAREPRSAALQWGYGSRWGALFGTVRRDQSEDCLHLNIWAPAAPSEAPRPVLVWVHGGAFVVGAGSTFLYQGDRLAVEGDLVVVTINYRLGPLGFLDLGGAAPGAGVPANLGLHDQLAAVAWVRSNIEAFGGDPDRVTVCGESAGAMSLGALLPLAAGRFDRAILQSGAAANVSTADEAEAIAERFLAAVGLRPRDAGRLRNLPAGRLMAASQGLVLRLRSWPGFLPWQPSVDGELVPRQPIDLVAEGAAAGIPLLLGTNRDEWRLFGPLERRYPLSRRRLRRLLSGTALSPRSRLVAATPGDGGSGHDAALDSLLERYGSVGGRRLGNGRLFDHLRTEECFRRPALELARAQARHASTYLYRFDYPVPLVGSSFGACHGAEIPLLFATDRHPLIWPLYLGRRQGDGLGLLLRRSWGAFARSGDPSHAECAVWRECGEEGSAVTLLSTAPRLAGAAGQLGR